MNLVYRHIRNQAALRTTPKWNQTNRRKTCNCIKRQKKKKRMEDLLALWSERILNFKPPVKSNCQTTGNKQPAPVLPWISPWHTLLKYDHLWSRSLTYDFSSHVAKAMVFIRSGELLPLLWGTVPAVGEALQKRPQALCEFDRPFHFNTAGLCSLGRNKKTKPKKKKRHLIISSDDSSPNFLLTNVNSALNSER